MDIKLLQKVGIASHSLRVNLNFRLITKTVLASKIVFVSFLNKSSCVSRLHLAEEIGSKWWDRESFTDEHYVC